MVLVTGVLVSGAWRSAPIGAPPAPTIAVFPVENLSGGAIPESEIRHFLIAALTENDEQVLEGPALERFFERHRVRYTGGIDVETAEALRAETGVRRVLMATVEQSATSLPPKVAICARLVSTDVPPTVVWAADVALAGDERPGWLDLGIVSDYETLQRRALERLARSLGTYLKTGQRPPPKAEKKFRPDAIYRQHVLADDRTYSVAVIPFVNLTDRGGAGDLIALMFVQHLSQFPQFKMLDPGVVRTQLLAARIILDGGVSLNDADTVAALVDADLVLGGRVLRYDGSTASPSQVRVEFSAVLIDRKSRRVVWSSDSHNDSREDVGLFERGASKTAHVMATQMVQLTAAAMVRRAR